MNLYHALYDHYAAHHPVLEEHDGRIYTAGQMRAAIGSMAAALAQCGVRPGMRVSFVLAKGPHVLRLAHACLQVGAIFHPLNPSYTEQEVDYLVRDADPALVVCEPQERGRFEFLRSVPVEIMTLDAEGKGSLGDLAASLAPLECVATVGPRDTAAILYTSGTTGKPKGAQITHGNLTDSARALAEVWSVTADDVLLHMLPMFHAHGLLTAVNTMLVAGGRVRMVPVFDPEEVVRALPSSTVIMGVPTHYARLLRTPGFAEAARASLRLAVSGSAPMLEGLAQAFREATGVALIERYGATESAIVTAVPAGTTDRAGWVGWALPGVEIRVRQSDGSCADRNAIGPLEVRGHNIFTGYWRRLDLLQDAFTEDGWFITGDVAEIDATGCVRLLDRTKDLIISGGLNVYPSEVEAALNRMGEVAECAVFGVPHPDFGEGVTAVVELEASAEIDEHALIERLKQVLAGYKVPKRILIGEPIPRNAMGKVQKAVLRDRYRALYSASK